MSWLLALLLFCAPAAWAQEEVEPDAEQRSWGPAEEPAPHDTEAITDKRDRPDIDGRGTIKRRGEDAEWVGRVPLAPLYALWRYVVFPPLSGGVKWSEKKHVPQKLRNAFTVGEGRTIGILPTAVIDFGFRTSVGLYGWSTGLPAKYVRSNLHVAFGGNKWWLVDYKMRVPLSEGARARNTGWAGSAITGRFVFQQRPDLVYAGLNDPGTEVVRYFRERIGGTIDSEIIWGLRDGLRLTAGIAKDRFGESGRKRGDDPSIETVYDTPWGGPVDGPAVPGLEGYTVAFADAIVHMDSRNDQPLPGSGVVLELGARVGSGLSGDISTYVRWHGLFAMLWDVNRYNHTLTLGTWVSGVEGFGSGVVPFEQMPTVGGSDLMRAFRPGLLRGESAAVWSFRYTWPIWAFLDGLFHVEFGNAFGDRFDGLTPGALRQSWALGVRSNANRDVAFELLFGLGTTRFEDGYAIDSVRLVFGTSRGF